jgi:hypothetical protein
MNANFDLDRFLIRISKPAGKSNADTVNQIPLGRRAHKTAKFRYHPNVAHQLPRP